MARGREDRQVAYSGWSPFTQKLVVVLLIIAVVSVLLLLRAVTTALMLTAFLAFLISPVADFLHAKARIPRLLAAVLVFVGAFVLVTAIVIVLAPIVVDQFSEIRFSFSESLEDGLAWTRDFLDNFRSVFGYDLSAQIEDLQERLHPDTVDTLFPGLDFLGGQGSGLLRAGTGALATALSTVGGFLFTFVLILVFTTYLVNDLPVLSRAVDGLIPADEKPDLEDLKRRLRGVWFAFVRGNLLLMAALGALVGVSMYIVGLPSALLLGIIAGLLAIIPTVGAFIAGVLMVAMALFQGSTWLPIDNVLFALIVLGIYLLLQWVEGNVLQPKIMGSAVDLPGFVAIVGIVVGLAVGGVLGAYLAIPIVASAREIFMYVYRKLEASGASGVPVSVPGGALWDPPADLLLPQTSYVSIECADARVLQWPGAHGAILCLHGITSNAMSFGGFAYAMGGRRMIVAHDLRGRGHTLGSNGPHGIEGHAKDALEILDALDVERATVVGHSYGAMVALALAARHADRVDGAVCIDGGAPMPDDVMADLWSAARELDVTAPSFDSYVAQIKRSGTFEAWNYFIERFYRDGVTEGPEGVRTRISRVAVEGDLEQLAVFPFEEYLDDLRVPVLVLQAALGSGETGRPVLTEEGGRRLASASPRGTFIRIPRATHASILYNRYGEVAFEVDRFMEAVAGDAPPEHLDLARPTEE